MSCQIKGLGRLVLFFLYYTLFSFQQLEISTEEILVNLFGDIKDDQFQLLYDYIRNIKLGNRHKVNSSFQEWKL